MPTNNDEWMSLAQQVSVEMDHAKLAILVGRLCQAIDDRGRLDASQERDRTDRGRFLSDGCML
jgi:hypothetical protein